MISYSEKLKDPRWQKKRLSVLNKSKFKCELCNDKNETLHVHHLSYEKNKEPWDYPLSNFKCLCSTCHEFITISNFIKYQDIIKVLKVRSLDNTRNNVYIKYYNKDLNSEFILGFGVDKKSNYPLIIHLSSNFLNTLNNQLNGI